MELTKVFLVAEVDNNGKLRQIALTKEEQNMLETMVRGGMFCEQIKLMPDVIGEVGGITNEGKELSIKKNLKKKETKILKKNNYQ